MSRKATKKSVDSAEDEADYIRRDSDGRFVLSEHDGRYSDKRSLSQDDNLVHRKGTGEGVPVTFSKGKLFYGEQSIGKRIVKSAPASALSQAATKMQRSAFSHDIFSSEEEYDRSVNSVVARITSGEVNEVV